jgi:ferritin-like metal-binding protein YciE
MIPKLDELFHDTLRDIYFAEKKILSALPKMGRRELLPDIARLLTPSPQSVLD